MPDQGTKTGRELERLVAQAYRDLGARTVVHDVDLAGHQIDVYVELETADRSLHRIAVEAKDYTRPVGIKIVSDYSTVVDRLRRKGLIDEGVIVSAAGFSRQARNAAEDEDLRLLEPADLTRLQDVGQYEPHISDSMWMNLIDLIEQRWRDKPREDLIRSVVGVRHEMTKCQESFHKLKKARLERDFDGYEVARDEWRRSLWLLGDAITGLDQVLAIFSPETHRYLHDYQGAEFDAFDAAAANLGGSVDFDLVDESLGETFATALERLDTFIRENFTLEEIHSV